MTGSLSHGFRILLTASMAVALFFATPRGAGAGPVADKVVWELPGERAVLTGDDLRAGRAKHVFTEEGPAARWYLVTLRARVTLASRSRVGGTAYVTTMTNGKAMSQTQLKLARCEDHQVCVHWNNLGYIDGFEQKTQSGRTIAFTFRNFLQLASVKQGENTVQLAIEEYDGATIEEVTLLQPTRIVRSATGPARLEVTGPATPLTAVVGQRVVVPVELRSVGERSVSHVQLFVSGAQDHFDGVRSPIAVGDVIGRRVVEIDLVPRDAGTFRVSVDALSGSNRPGTDIRIVVGPSPSGSERMIRLAIGLGTMLAGLIGYVGWRRLRSRAGAPRDPKMESGG